MDDYAALVERVCFVLPKVLGCLLLSEDGLVLSGHPDGDNVAEVAWRHFFSIQEPVRGFLAFDDQNWIYVRHGSYAVFVVADMGVRPGVLMDQLEQVLTGAVAAVPVETFRVPEAIPAAPPQRGAPASEPDAPPVRARPPDTVGVAAEPESKKGESKKSESKKGDAKKSEAAPIHADPPAALHEPAVVAAPAPAAAIDFGGAWAPDPKGVGSEDEESEIDRVQLAQEFSGLLQMDRADDEASS